MSLYHCMREKMGIFFEKNPLYQTLIANQISLYLFIQQIFPVLCSFQLLLPLSNLFEFWSQTHFRFSWNANQTKHFKTAVQRYPDPASSAHILVDKRAQTTH